MFLGIDPGVSGGIAFIDGPNHKAFKMPDTERDLWELFDYLRGLCTHESIAYIERLGNMPRDENGKARQSPTTMFKMGTSYGGLRMAIVGNAIPMEEIAATKWQAHFGLTRTDKNESSTDKKNRHKAKAQMLFPALKVTLATCDAILIAEYARRLAVKPDLLTPKA
jgi:hypothetical protein